MYLACHFYPNDFKIFLGSMGAVEQIQQYSTVRQYSVILYNKMASNGNEIVANEDMDVLLHTAGRRKSVVAVRDCLQKGAIVNGVHDQSRTTPSYDACTRGANDEIVRILLDAGADPQLRQECTGFTAAQMACTYGTDSCPTSRFSSITTRVS